MPTYNTGPVTSGLGNTLGNTWAANYQVPGMNPSPYTPPQTSSPQGGSNFWSRQSPQTQGALINTGASLLGGYLSQRNTNQQQANQNQFNAQQNALNEQAATERLSMQLEQSRMLAEKELGLQATQMAPQRQDWRQGQALLADILPQARNYQVTPPGDLGRYMPQLSGGLRLPEGGLSAEALSFYSPQSRLAAEMDLDRNAAMASGGRYATPDYALAGYGPQGLQASQQVNDYTQMILQDILKQASLPDEAKARGLTSGTQTGKASGTAVSRASLPAYSLAGGKPEYGETYWEQVTNAPSSTNARKYEGGKSAPMVDQLTPKMRGAIQQNYGVDGRLKEDEVKELVKSGWQYGMPAPKDFEYDDDTGLLKKKGSVWKTIGKVAIIAGAAAASIATAGAASPWLAVALGAGAGAGVGAIDNGWKGALIGAGTGALTGGVGAGLTQAGVNQAGQALAQAGTGAALGGMQGGAKGALLGGIAGGGGAAIGGIGNQMAKAGAPMYGQAAANAGMTIGLNKAMGNDWTTSGFYGGLGAANTALVRRT